MELPLYHNHIFQYLPHFKIIIFAKLSITLFITLIGTAKPIPSAEDIFTVLIPITSPAS